MTNDEIQAHHAQLRKALQGQTTGLHAVSCAAIETLLAREAEVLEEVGDEPGTFCYNCQSDVEFDAEYYCPQCRSYAFYHDSDRRIRAILYPQPAASIRDIADRHGFAPMPAELGQRNVNDHTTTAAMAEEKTNNG